MKKTITLTLDLILMASPTLILLYNGVVELVRLVLDNYKEIVNK